jgi:excisionase family DNA binding protein
VGNTAVDISRLMTVREAAELLRLSPSTVYQKTERGELGVVRLGRGPKPRIRITAEALRRYVTEGVPQ